MFQAEKIVFMGGRRDGEVKEAPIRLPDVIDGRSESHHYFGEDAYVLTAISSDGSEAMYTHMKMAEIELDED